MTISVTFTYILFKWSVPCIVNITGLKHQKCIDKYIHIYIYIQLLQSNCFEYNLMPYTKD